MSKTASGRAGEQIAYQYLIKAGYKILERNFRTKIGEIDLIALEGDCLVFVEVKARWSKQFGAPEEAITPRKLHSIAQVGEIFRLLGKSLPPESRIDVVAIEFGSEGQTQRIELFKSVTS